MTRLNGYLEPGARCRKCHEIEGDIDCTFCYCPLYHDADCPGDYVMRGEVRDCSQCLLPHQNPELILKIVRETTER